MKQYNGEKAIISLTSWKARINTVSKTIYSLIQQCPVFHIVLCLSEEEFPKKEAELPENLMLFIENDLIEILWVYKNYKSFKKVLFTMDKYRDVPVISADDDCIYTCNYAEKLYQTYQKHKNEEKAFVIRYTPRKEYTLQGPCSLYYGLNDIALSLVNSLSAETINKSQDDQTLGTYFSKMNIKRFNATNDKYPPFKFHDTINPITKNQKQSPFYKYCF